MDRICKAAGFAVSVGLLAGAAGTPALAGRPFATIAVPGADQTFAVGINDSSEIVGYYAAGRTACALADKIAGLRIFNDEAGKMNLGLADVKGSMLVVSQFTLLGDCSHGRRPSFTSAAPPEVAEHRYEQFVARVRELGIPVRPANFVSTCWSH